MCGGFFQNRVVTEVLATAEEWKEGKMCCGVEGETSSVMQQV